MTDVPDNTTQVTSHTGTSTPSKGGKPVNRFALAGFFILIGIAVISYVAADIAYARQLLITPDYGSFEDWLHRNGIDVLLGNPLTIPGIITSVVFSHIALTKQRRHLWGTAFAVITLIAGYLAVLAGIIGIAILVLLLIAFAG